MHAQQRPCITCSCTGKCINVSSQRPPCSHSNDLSCQGNAVLPNSRVQKSLGEIRNRAARLRTAPAAATLLRADLQARYCNCETHASMARVSVKVSHRGATHLAHTPIACNRLPQQRGARPRSRLSRPQCWRLLAQQTRHHPHRWNADTRREQTPRISKEHRGQHQRHEPCHCARGNCDKTRCYPTERHAHREAQEEGPRSGTVSSRRSELSDAPAARTSGQGRRQRSVSDQLDCFRWAGQAP